ncbi:MAG: cob(I)yrinic acid a,c-diamide adenosyltransferase [Actinomycetota bacterium]|nr:cob(I)yrinic acid a,c-diamide adenosyltransferase [Actinomycetota bacterium]
MKLKRGLIQIYTGDGKGKTTAAIGQAMRALGHEFKVGMASFFKDPDLDYGELKVLRNLRIDIFRFAPKHPHFCDVDFKEVREDCLKALRFIQEIFEGEEYDLLILDEINVALRDGFLTKEEIFTLLDKKPQHLELILTGRGATEALIAKADLATEMKKIKHPFDRGIKGRKGIEF